MRAAPVGCLGPTFLLSPRKELALMQDVAAMFGLQAFTEPHAKYVLNSLHTPFRAFTWTLFSHSQSVMLEDIWAF